MSGYGNVYRLLLGIDILQFLLFLQPLQTTSGGNTCHLADFFDIATDQYTVLTKKLCQFHIYLYFRQMSRMASGLWAFSFQYPSDFAFPEQSKIHQNIRYHRYEHAIHLSTSLPTNGSMHQAQHHIGSCQCTSHFNFFHNVGSRNCATIYNAGIVT